MFNMLIVDDNRLEREGAKFLIDQFEWKMNIAESDSGESAIAYLESHPIDILLTDIKMRAMDGLQLAEKVRESYPGVKIIFMSAFGEFEYAQKAIDLDAIQYILKPVEIGEFMRVVSKVIRLCEEDRQVQENQNKMLEVYGKGLRFEKEKLLYDIIYGKSLYQDGEQDSDTVFDFNGCRYMRMALLDASTRLFDRSDFDIGQSIEAVINRKVDILHLNERQSLLFYEGWEEETEEELLLAGRAWIERLKEEKGVDFCLVFSKLIERLQHIQKEYADMEAILANQFFMDGGAVFYTGSVHGGDTEGAEYAANVLNESMSYMQSQRIGENDQKKLYALIESVRSHAYYSESYVKYVFMEMLKIAIGPPVLQHVSDFTIGLDRIYNATTLNELQSAIIPIMVAYNGGSGSSSDSLRKVIDDVVHMIEQDYGSDISLESLAQSVYLSPAYLSRLFKKQTGKSIIKHITSVRLEKADQLLLESNKKITDICREVGYHNFAYFSSLFKNHYGRTPSQYREEHERVVSTL